jgi:hypothetical protein
MHSTRRPLVLAATLAVLVPVCGTACKETSRRSRPAEPADAFVEPFVDRAAASGLDFVHFNGMSGRFYQPEITGPGAGVLDYDGDGDLDVYLVQGQPLGPVEGAPAALRGRLYRNDLTIAADGSRRLRFTDVTEASRIDARAYGMGVAAGDVDNDGCVDLYLTNFGPNALWRNNCDGTFTDVSRESGTADPGWSVSAAFLDFDRDGWLDLFVGNYLRYTLETHVRCFSPSGDEEYCPPGRYLPERSRLYRNRGNGTFSDVTAAAGLAHEFGPALGVATADFDGDGWIDIFVANDQRENQLWMNGRDGTFTNAALLAGVALDLAGMAKADMGVDAGDPDNDGDEDLFMTDLSGEGSTLYINDGSGMFGERSTQAGIRAASLPYTGWGTAWIDVDNDGALDILAVNGLVRKDLEALAPGNPFPYQQPKQLFRNLGGGRFEAVTRRAGDGLERADVSRGAAFGDIDNDGDIDVVVANDAGPVRLLVNEVGARRRWMGLTLRGAEWPRDMLGARVAVTLADGSRLWRRASAVGWFAFAKDP